MTTQDRKWREGAAGLDNHYASVDTVDMTNETTNQTYKTGTRLAGTRRNRSTCRRCSHSWMWHGYGDHCDYHQCKCSRWVAP